MVTAFGVTGEHHQIISNDRRTCCTVVGCLLGCVYIAGYLAIATWDASCHRRLLNGVAGPAPRVCLSSYRCSLSVINVSESESGRVITARDWALLLLVSSLHCIAADTAKCRLCSSIWPPATRTLMSLPLPFSPGGGGRRSFAVGWVRRVASRPTCRCLSRYRRCWCW